MPFLLYLILLVDVGGIYVTLMKTFKMVVFLLFIYIFPVVIICLLIYNVMLGGLMGVLVVGVYFVYMVSSLPLVLYCFQYFLLGYDVRLVILGVFPIMFMFVKIGIVGFVSVIFLYIILLFMCSYL